MARGPHPRAPELNAARHEEVSSAFFLVSPAQLIFAAGYEIDREELAVMRMARKLYIDARPADGFEVGRPMIEKN